MVDVVVAPAVDRGTKPAATAPLRVAGGGVDTIVQAFWQCVACVPDRPALRTRNAGGWTTVTWSGYGQQVQAVAAGLITLGLNPGDRIAILAGNRAEWHVADLASMSAGCVTVPLYPTSSAEQVGYVLKHAQARVCFVENTEQLGKVLLVRDRLGCLMHIVCFEDDGSLDDPTVLDFAALAAVGREHGGSGDAVQRRADAVSADDLATLVYTSGTTGPPKGVMITHGNIMWTARSVVSMLDVHEGERFLSFLPLSHIAERMMSDLGAIAVAGETWFARSLATVAADLKDCRPTVFFAVPRVWEKLRDAILEKVSGRSLPARWLIAQYVRSADRWGHTVLDSMVGAAIRKQAGLDQAHILITAAAPIHPDVLRWFQAIGVPVVELYGQTETCGPTTCNPQDANHIGTVGVPIPGVTVHIADDAEVLVKGGNCCAGYYDDAHGTAALLDRDGWLHSGDLGVIDADGYLHITGRKKDLIITAAGQNISPQEIEVDLRNHELISEAVVIGEGRRYLTALITLAEEAVLSRGRDRGRVAASEALAEDPEVVAEVEQIIAEVNARRSRVEHIRKHRILSRDWTVGAGELTPTGKVKRDVIAKRYGSIIESMYAEDAAAPHGGTQ